MPTRYPVSWSDLGRVDYERALELQSALWERAVAGAEGYLLFLEHPPTITLGYSLKGDEGRSAIRSGEDELSAAGIRVVQVDRGGKATYHGPGQLVCYLILSLKELRLGVKRFVGRIENVVLGSLRELGVAAELNDSYPGVWVADAKVAAVGIRVADRVSTHGFALNLDPDLAAFRHIVPCGIADRPVTSLADLGVPVPGRNKLLEMLLRHLEEEMKIEPVAKEPAQLCDQGGGLAR